MPRALGHVDCVGLRPGIPVLVPLPERRLRFFSQVLQPGLPSSIGPRPVQARANQLGKRPPPPAIDHSIAKQQLRPRFRALRRQALLGASEGLRQVALRRLPELVGPDQHLGLYWPLGSEPDLNPWRAGGLAEQLAATGRQAGMNTRLALPAVLPAPPGATQGRLVYLPWQRGAQLQPDACGIPAPLPPGEQPCWPRDHGPTPGMPAALATAAARPHATASATSACTNPPGAAGRLEATAPGDSRGELLPAESRPPEARAGLTPTREGLAPDALPPEALSPEALALLLVPALALDRHGIRLGSGGGWYDRLRADPRWRAVPALAVLPSACRCALLPRDPWDIPFDGWLDEQGLGWCNPGPQARDAPLRPQD